MRTSRLVWALVGIVTGVAGVATSYLAASLMNLRESPVVAVAEMVIALVPGSVAEFGISLFGTHDKLALVIGVGVLLTIGFSLIGIWARDRRVLSYIGLFVFTAIGVIATLTRESSSVTNLLPTVVGVVTWVGVLTLLGGQMERSEDEERAARNARTPDPGEEPEPERVELFTAPSASRRSVLISVAAVAVASGVIGVGGRLASGGRRRVEAARKLLRLQNVTAPAVPAGVSVDGVGAWMTPANRFYLIDTAVIKPAIEPKDWSLRIHGMVDRELTLSFDELIAREFTEDWITLNCVSNEVGGDLIGNAWWSGVRLAGLLEEVGVSPDADAILQTSDDGWTCGTPIETVTDDRNAMLAVAMNGEPLPLEHGFPVRTIVPGLYGYVSATKWVVDIEVTKFSEFTAFWSDKGWTEKGPVKIASRIDTPRSGDSIDAGDSGDVRVGGVAWHQHTGIEKVEVSVDDGDWEEATLAKVPSIDTWVQWTVSLPLDSGEHRLTVRATGADGEVQTSEEAPPAPDGSTGLHSVTISVS